jgi:uncharacterized protein YggU (UPF0235/DUF167 family)
MSDSSENLLVHAELLRRRLRQEGTLMLDIKAVPRARSAGVSDVMSNGALKVKVTAAPEKGRANDEVLAVLAVFFDLPKRNFEIIAGHTSAQKRVKVSAA